MPLNSAGTMWAVGRLGPLGFLRGGACSTADSCGHPSTGDNLKMIRVRSLATTCARECVRSATAIGRGGGSRAAVTARGFSESNLPSAEPPVDTAAVHASTDPLHVGDPGALQPGRHQQGSEERAEDVGELLRRQTQAREDWTRPLELSDYQRATLSKDLVLRIKGLSKAPKATKVGTAISIVDEGRRQGVTNLQIYRMVLKQLLTTYAAGESASRNLEAILARMREDGLEPDLKTYNLILDFHASVRAPKKAAKVYEELLSKGLTPDQKTASHMIVAHSRGSHDLMYRTVEEMYANGWKGSRTAYLSMIAVMGIRKDYDGVLHTFHRMREEAKRPTEAACVVAFRAAETLGQVEAAKQVFEHRIEVGLPPQAYPYVKMMVLLLKDGRPEEGLEYWRRLVCVNGLNGIAITPETYNLAIKCAARAGNVEEIEGVVAMMEAQGVVPTEATYASALAGFETPLGAGPPPMEEAERALAVIARTGPPPGSNVHLRQAVGYAHAGMWQKALDLFGPLLVEKRPMSARDWKCVMMSQFELGRYEEVKATWILYTEGRKTSPSHTAFKYALSAAGLLEDVDWALQLLEAAKKEGKRSVHSDHAAVEYLLKAGRLEQARAILKEWEAHTFRGPKLRLFGRSYELALAICEERGDAQLALRFFDGMRSATPPYMPSSSCPSFVFLLKALKDNDRAEEVRPFFDDFVASEESAGQTSAPSPECFTVLAEAEALSHGRTANEDPKSPSAEAWIDTGCGEDDDSDAGPSHEAQGRETGEGEAGGASSPRADVLA